MLCLEDSVYLLEERRAQNYSRIRQDFSNVLLSEVLLSGGGGAFTQQLPKQERGEAGGEGEGRARILGQEKKNDLLKVNYVP